MIKNIIFKKKAILGIGISDCVLNKENYIIGLKIIPNRINQLYDPEGQFPLLYDLNSLEEFDLCSSKSIEDYTIECLKYDYNSNLIFCYSLGEIFYIDINDSYKRVVLSETRGLDKTKLCISNKNTILFNLLNDNLIREFNYKTKKTTDFSYYNPKENYTKRLEDFEVSSNGKYLAVLLTDLTQQE